MHFVQNRFIQLIAIASTGTTKLYTMVVEPMIGFLVDNIYITIRYRYHHYYFYYYYAVIVFVTIINAIRVKIN